MNYPMHESDVLQEINHEAESGGDQSRVAERLLLQADPAFRRRFYAAARNLSNLLKDVQVYFPDAQLYTAGGGLTLMLGNPHDTRERPQHNLMAVSAGHLVRIGDGDF